MLFGALSRITVQAINSSLVDLQLMITIRVRGSPMKCGEWPCLKRLAEDVSWHIMLSWEIEIVESFESAILIGFVFGVEEFHAFKIIICFVQLGKNYELLLPSSSFVLKF